MTNKQTQTTQLSITKKQLLDNWDNDELEDRLAKTFQEEIDKEVL